MARQEFLDERWAQWFGVTRVIDRFCRREQRGVDLLVEVVLDDAVDSEADRGKKHREPHGVAQGESQPDGNPVEDHLLASSM